MEAKQMLEQAGYGMGGSLDATEAANLSSRLDTYMENTLPEPPFKVGDVVQLKSGGPAMTVTAIQPFYIQVAYFFEGTRLTDSLIPPDALRLSAAPVPEATEDTSYVDMTQ